MKFNINKKVITSIIVTILLLSALVYNILYMNNEKNEIINEIEEDSMEEEIEVEEVKTIFVDVGGEVMYPGLYELPEGSRVNDAIVLAGGSTEKADITTVNLAYILSDAMKITIPKKEVKKVVSVNNTPKSVTTIAISTIEEASQSVGIININTANKEQLCTLSGIGDSTAQKIIDYRNSNGSFKSIEDIKNVSGIGNSKFENIKSKITI